MREPDTDALTKKIKQLQKRMHDYNDDLGNELLTRYVLIDPLLRELGWDTEDPTQVRVEYPVIKGSKKHADYVLFVREQAIAVIEAKKYGTFWCKGKELPFWNAVYQCKSYSFGKFKPPLGIVTDGWYWYILNFNTRGPIKKRKAVGIEFDTDTTTEEGIMKAALDAIKLAPTRIASLAKDLE